MNFNFSIRECLISYLYKEILRGVVEEGEDIEIEKLLNSLSIWALFYKIILFAEEDAVGFIYQSIRKITLALRVSIISLTAKRERITIIELLVYKALNVLFNYFYGWLHVLNTFILWRLLSRTGMDVIYFWNSLSPNF